METNRKEEIDYSIDYNPKDLKKFQEMANFYKERVSELQSQSKT